MSTVKQRRTLTLEPEAVRRANRLRKHTSLSAFVNDALATYTNELERIAYTASPLSDDERQFAVASAASFVGDDTGEPREPRATQAGRRRFDPLRLHDRRLGQRVCVFWHAKEYMDFRWVI